MRGDTAAVERARELEEDLVQQRVSTMTLFELFYGDARSPQPNEERRQVEEVLETKPTYSADAAVMRKAGRLSRQLANQGQTVGDGDVIVWATALINEEPLLTRNVEDFERLGVAVERYRMLTRPIRFHSVREPAGQPTILPVKSLPRGY